MPCGSVVDARPEILNHNVETVPRLFRKVQPQDRYEWAAATLSNAKRLDPEVLTKSGIMLGLGETLDEVQAVMRDLRAWGVDILTLGQYLQPSKQHLPIERYVHAGRVRRPQAPTASRSASAGSSPARWCAPRTTPSSRSAR